MHKIIKAIVISALPGALAACAGSVAAPVSVRALSPQQLSTLHLSDITAEAAQGVQIAPSDMDRITGKIKADIAAVTPGILNASGMDAMKMKLLFTRYDAGSATSRLLLAGLGQIRIDAQVMLLDQSGTMVGQYQVSKQFALGGIAGAATGITDVEEGFEKSVVEIVKTKMK
jgi:hypothetical protein